jgi:hypothetical protein
LSGHRSQDFEWLDILSLKELHEPTTPIDYDSGLPGSFFCNQSVSTCPEFATFPDGSRNISALFREVYHGIIGSLV